MDSIDRYENYPLGVVLFSNFVSLSIYAIGAIILWQITPYATVLFLAFCVYLEFNVLRHSCRDCYYYGKICCFGKGALCSRIFEKGDPRRFIEKHVTWRSVLPDFMVTIIPVVAGVGFLLFDHFSWTVTGLTLALVALGFAGTAFIRSAFACRYCKQRDLGCPALKMFEKKAAEK